MRMSIPFCSFYSLECEFCGDNNDGEGGSGCGEIYTREDRTCRRSCQCSVVHN